MMRLILGILFLANFAWGQLSVSNMAELQRGNLPRTGPDDLLSGYNQLDAAYRFGDFSVGARWEGFQSDPSDRTYQHLAQRYAEWRNRGWRVRAGNFYTTLGRGLLLRGFELPNVIFEQREFRQRYAFYRDLDGLLVDGRWKKFEFTALYGEPLNNAVPPSFESARRSDPVTGGQLVFRPSRTLRFGVAVLHQNAVDETYNSFFTQVGLSALLQKLGAPHIFSTVYLEHARRNANLQTYFLADKKTPHATYASWSASYQTVGVSLEYKDYRDFENRINVPPIAYMEHSYYLLNRVTHEMLAEAERGFQIELTYQPTESVYLLVNRSEAVNDFQFSSFYFYDQMLEATLYPHPAVTAKIFYNSAEDELRGELDRKTAGISGDWRVSGPYSVSVDVQYQTVDRGFDSYQNSYFSLTFGYSPMLSISLGLDRTTDPLETADSKDTKTWFNGGAALQLGQHHDVGLFWGNRRGGLVCSSGTCYEVLPFEGLEVRWVLRY